MFCEEFWTDYILWQFYVQLFCESQFIWPNTQKPFCAITNLLCIGYLLPPAYVVLRKGNVLVMSVCLFTGGPIWPLPIMLLGSHSPPPTTTTRTPATCHPTSTRGPLPPPLSYGHLGPHYMEMPSPPPPIPPSPHTQTSIGKRAAGLQLQGFPFSLSQSNFWITKVVLCSTLCIFRSLGQPFNGQSVSVNSTELWVPF